MAVAAHPGVPVFRVDLACEQFSSPRPRLDTVRETDPIHEALGAKDCPYHRSDSVSFKWPTWDNTPIGTGVKGEYVPSDTENVAICGCRQPRAQVKCGA